MPINLQGMLPLLQVFDLCASTIFTGKLGFKVVEQAPIQTNDCEWALLTLNDMSIMLNTAYERQDRPACAKANHIAAHSDTTIYFGAPNVDEVYEHLHQQDNVERPFITPLGFKSLSIADQDGYNLCFHWPVK